MDTAKGTNIEPLHFNVDDALVLELGYQDIYHQYFRDLLRYGIKERVLVREGDTTRYGPYKTTLYKWMPKDLFSQNGYSLYGNVYSIFTFGETNRVINIESPLVAEIIRRQFEDTWKQAKPQPEVPCLYDEYEKKF